ncbi:hypothetical protein HVZ38_14110 [Citrobacter freundii]|uniref:hypothetical protein n=1 Tax=Citrobacter braakii TaxID=57706 RepID=UPI0015EA8487|nr:hypothetical protein [Citrobacter braakii]QMD48363.1 hypothetical protein HVZ40_14115 [Citrobacter freundii]QMD58175.1 hypothetical protein HVZ38_14110 [Citrobacter freundii]
MGIIGSTNFEQRAKIAYDEMSSLVLMATNLHSELRMKKRELQNTLLYYILFTSLFGTAFVFLKTIVGFTFFDKTETIVTVFSFISFIAFTLTSIIKIKNIKDDIKYDSKNLMELMEIIFNLRKIFRMYEFEPEYLKILDLKLKRLRFN